MIRIGYEIKNDYEDIRLFLKKHNIECVEKMEVRDDFQFLEVDCSKLKGHTLCCWGQYYDAADAEEDKQRIYPDPQFANDPKYNYIQRYYLQREKYLTLQDAEEWLFFVCLFVITYGVIALNRYNPYEIEVQSDIVCVSLEKFDVDNLLRLETNQTLIVSR